MANCCGHLPDCAKPGSGSAVTGARVRRPDDGPRPVRMLRHDPSIRPFIVIWEATRARSLACRHCRAEARIRRDPAELDTAQAEKLLREIAAFGRCGRCEFRTVCGGSRSRAFALTGDAYAEEPWCGYRPGSFPYQRELSAALAAAGHVEL
ncbi:hypothetical protein TH66_13065 [Carbonactinospora thermoautotrophica]|uniref:4Fe4S-binding SPASM domain-containing protein n=2 Tax=Carbonactinospora thermoautotrophica TaxID=1469144 RepID=A0A132NKV8_9ACTN|nr:hypothetical protein [Carbonactinospora thermoautotrophica]KWX03723.1 hypothetical protein TH66_13065 [Carbonactinospora thermoautotrophica]KWX10715.1 hypothetical protein TR74_01970 [Carbonactinospora thermoautotrophica]